MASFLDGLSGGHFGGADSHPSALPANRLDSLFVSLDTTDAAQVDVLLTTLSQSGILASLDSDSSAQHRLTVRINSLISSHKLLGFRLAQLWLAQSPSIWHSHLVNHASSWVSHVINLLGSYVTRNHPDPILLEAALALLTDHVLIENSAARQEFHRQAVTPNLPKVASALYETINHIVSTFGPFVHASALVSLVKPTLQLVMTHPAAFRPLASRIATLCNSLLLAGDRIRAASPDLDGPYLPTSLVSAVVTLLSNLHVTGAQPTKSNDGQNSRTTQAQLWQSTLAYHLQLAHDSWRACVSSFEARTASSSTTSSSTGNGEQLCELPKDPILATRLALSRVELLLGGSGQPGVIPLLLRTPTPRPVPVPFGALLSLGLSMLRVDVETPHLPGSEQTLCALQAALLPRLYSTALSLIAQVALISPAAVSLHAAELLTELCRVSETARDNARLRMATLRVMEVLVTTADVPLDPAGRVTLRLARVAAAEVASAVLAAPTSNGSTRDAATLSQNGSSRKAKKARLYESDSIFGTSSANPKDAVQRLSPVEQASVAAALSVLASVFPYLTTNMSAKHHEQAHTSAQVVCALVEVLADAHGGSAHSLLSAALYTAATVVRAAPGSMLALALPRLAPTVRAIHAAARDPATRTAAADAVSSLRTAKLVPIARGTGFDEPPERSKAPSRTIDLSGPASPSPARAKRVFSPDPVKPAHRPTTPRIGSPRGDTGMEDTVADVFGGGGSPSRAPPSATDEIGTAAPHPPPPQEALQEVVTEIVETVTEVPADTSASSIIVDGEPLPAPASAPVAEPVVEAPAPASALDPTAVVAETTVRSTPSTGAGGDRDNDDDDDEEMPEIDMGDSDSD